MNSIKEKDLIIPAIDILECENCYENEIVTRISFDKKTGMHLCDFCIREFNKKKPNRGIKEDN